MRRVYTIYFFSDFKEVSRGRDVVQTLMDDGLIPDDFQSKMVKLCGEAPNWSKSKDFLSFCNMCPEVNLYDNDHGLPSVARTACITGNWDRERYPKFKALEFRHYTNCPEYNSIRYSKELKISRRRSKCDRPRISKGMRFEILQRDKFRCVYCGNSAAEGFKLHIDHIVPYSDKGGDTFENLVTACEACNQGKSNKHL
jgi:hypothetical protein